MTKYEMIDKVVEEFTAEELADYLTHNWEGYVWQLAVELSIQPIIEDKEKTDARED